MLKHKHLIVRAEVENPPVRAAYVKKWLEVIIEGIGMKLAVGLEANPIAYRCDTEGNEGVTGVAILETSHCAIHVWDGDRPYVVQFDLYSCSDYEVKEVLKYINLFNPTKIEYKFFDRETGLEEIRNDKEDNSAKAQTEPSSESGSKDKAKRKRIKDSVQAA